MTRGTWRYRAACKIAAFFTALWYGLTQRAYLLFSPNTPVGAASSFLEIATRLSFGQQYRPDRMAGAMTHPACVQWKVDDESRVGDCEDHMGFWTVAAHRGKLVEKTYMGIAMFRGSKNVLEGHVVCLLRTAAGLAWADYGTPSPTTPTTWVTWAHEVASAYGSRLTFAYAVETWVDEHDTVRFKHCIPYAG